MTKTQMAMKFGMKFGLICIALACLANTAMARPCGECKKILGLKAEYEDSKGKPGHAHDSVANKITEIINNTKKQADGKVDKPLIDAVITIMRVDSDNAWFRQLFVEKNLTFFENNRDSFAEQLKKIPQKEAKEILEDIDAKIREMKSGNDPGSSSSKKKN